MDDTAGQEVQPDAPAGAVARSYGIVADPTMAASTGRPVCGALLGRGMGRCTVLLPPGRTRGCSDAHRVRLWDEAHPYDGKPTPGPARDETESRSAAVRRAILALPEFWREPSDYCRALGMTWAAIHPRLKELRRSKYGAYDVQRSFRGTRDGVKVYVYRIRRANESE